MKKSSILVALLGVVIGLLIALLVYRVGESRRMMRVNGNDWRKVSLILQSIDENYVDSVDRAKVSDAIAAAALSALDPHSSYMPPQVLEDSEADLMGNFDGIGIQFNVPNDTAVVIEVIPGGPSEKIGLQPGDRLLKVDDTNIAGVHFPQDSMVRRIKGVAGSKVLVTVQRGREVIPFEITRGKIPTWSVDASFMVNETTGYLRLSKFSRTTEDEILLHCTELLSEGMTELILDLRDNSGGYLDQACKLSNFFLPRKAMIVYLEGRHRKREEFRRRLRSLPEAGREGPRGRGLRLRQRDPRGRAAGQRPRAPLRPPHLRQGPRAGAVLLQRPFRHAHHRGALLHALRPLHPEALHRGLRI